MIFADIVEARDSDAASWLRTKAPQLPLRVAFARCARMLGDAMVEPTAAEASSLTELAPDDRVHAQGWRLCDHGRAELFHKAIAGLEAPAQVELYGTLVRRGEIGEQESLLRVVTLLPERVRFVKIAIDACRTNAEDVFAAISCENPYPAACFPDHNFNQMVLKAIFIGLDVRRVVGLQGRVTPELVRMAQGYASERQAAGRSVPEDIARIVRMLEEQ